MKVKELIKLLQEANPDGEKEVIITGEWYTFTPNGVECYEKNYIQIYE